MNKIFNAEKTWAILFTENLKAGFDFSKDLIQIVKDYADKIPTNFLIYATLLQWVWAREFRRNIVGGRHYVGMLKSQTEIDAIFQHIALINVLLRVRLKEIRKARVRGFFKSFI